MSTIILRSILGEVSTSTFQEDSSTMATEKENFSHDELGTGHAHAKMSVGRYIATRIPTLKPPMAKVPNPIRLLRLLNFQQWMFFLVAFLAWTWDAFDFFTVSLTVENLAETFGKTKTDITWVGTS